MIAPLPTPPAPAKTFTDRRPFSGPPAASPDDADGADFSTMMAKAAGTASAPASSKAATGKTAAKDATDSASVELAAATGVAPQPLPPPLLAPAPLGGPAAVPSPLQEEAAGEAIAAVFAQAIPQAAAKGELPGKSSPTTAKDAAKKADADETPSKGRPETTAKHPPKLNGMPVAKLEQRMKSAPEQNKIAESEAQKMPAASALTSAAAVKAEASTAKMRLPVDFSPQSSALEQLSIQDAIKSSSTPSAAVTTAVAAVTAPGQTERVEQLISREAVSFKNSGANEVGVTLKIDAHTQLFLQLSYRDGQTQAQLRYDKGEIPTLAAHFSQLQESLAKQNIQLQPASASSGSNPDFNRQGSSSDGRGQNSSPTPQAWAEDDTTKPAPARQNKPTTVSRQGWESWA